MQPSEGTGRCGRGPEAPIPWPTLPRGAEHCPALALTLRGLGRLLVPEQRCNTGSIVRDSDSGDARPGALTALLSALSRSAHSVLPRLPTVCVVTSPRDTACKREAELQVQVFSKANLFTHSALAEANSFPQAPRLVGGKEPLEAEPASWGGRGCRSACSGVERGIRGDSQITGPVSGRPVREAVQGHAVQRTSSKAEGHFSHPGHKPAPDRRGGGTEGPVHLQAGTAQGAWERTCTSRQGGWCWTP